MQAINSLLKSYGEIIIDLRSCILGMTNFYDYSCKKMIKRTNC